MISLPYAFATLLILVHTCTSEDLVPTATYVNLESGFCSSSGITLSGSQFLELDLGVELASSFTITIRARLRSTSTGQRLFEFDDGTCNSSAYYFEVDSEANSLVKNTDDPASAILSSVTSAAIVNDNLFHDYSIGAFDLGALKNNFIARDGGGGAGTTYQSDFTINPAFPVSSRTRFRIGGSSCAHHSADLDIEFVAIHHTIVGSTPFYPVNTPTIQNLAVQFYDFKNCDESQDGVESSAPLPCIPRVDVDANAAPSAFTARMESLCSDLDSVDPVYGPNARLCTSGQRNRFTTRMHDSMANGLFGGAGGNDRDCDAYCLYDIQRPDHFYRWKPSKNCWIFYKSGSCKDASASEVNYAVTRQERLCDA